MGLAVNSHGVMTRRSQAASTSRLLCNRRNKLLNQNPYHNITITGPSSLTIIDSLSRRSSGHRPSSSSTYSSLFSPDVPLLHACLPCSFPFPVYSHVIPNASGARSIIREASASAAALLQRVPILEMAKQVAVQG